LVQHSDLARAYYVAIQRERSQERLQERLRLRDLTGQEIVEVTVPRGAALVGMRLRDARLPRESIVVAVRRDGATLFPHGDTAFEPNDTVVANVAPGHGPRFRALVTAKPGDAQGHDPPAAS
ncbi:MAG: TrkA C-terminal domain-containing protein, partial [Trueperaceae bacterium]